MLVTPQAHRLRHLAGAGATRPSIARLLVAALMVSLGLGTGPALAQGPGPEQPPVKAPAKLGPDPAPVPARSSAPSNSTTQPPAVTSTPSRPTVPAAGSTPTPSSSTHPSSSKVVSSPRAQSTSRPMSKPRHAPAKPQPTKTARKRSPSIERVTRAALGATRAQPGGSNRLLFLGGLALLVLVLGDAAFLTLSARVLRDPAQR